jgi:hypothetical protein
MCIARGSSLESTSLAIPPGKGSPKPRSASSIGRGCQIHNPGSGAACWRKLRKLSLLGPLIAGGCRWSRASSTEGCQGRAHTEIVAIGHITERCWIPCSEKSTPPVLLLELGTLPVSLHYSTHPLNPSPVAHRCPPRRRGPLQKLRCGGRTFRACPAWPAWTCLSSLSARRPPFNGLGGWPASPVLARARVPTSR